MSYKMCAWDLDGTLFHTLPTLHYYDNLALEHFGFQPISYEQGVTLIKFSIHDYYRELLKMGGCPQERVDELAEEFLQYDYQIYMEDPTLHLEPFPGIRETLQALHGMGIRNVVLSNKFEDVSAKIVSHYFKSYIEAVYGQIASSVPKPKVGSTDRMLEASGLARNEILIIGDTEVDMLTAKNNRFPVCAVTWGYQDTDVLKRYEPDHLIDEPVQLLKIIKEINHV